MFRYVLMVGALVCGMTAAQAATFRLELAKDDKDLGARLAQLALSNEAASRDPQDIVSAAQADYARMIAALYDEGYFGPVVSILIDGREAADIVPVTPPESVDTIVIKITPGTRFRFGQASLTPLVGGTVLPPEFATGQPTSTGVIRTAVDAGIDKWRDRGHAKARLSAQDITAQHPQKQLDVRAVLDPGPKLRFGDAIITGNKDVRLNRIRKIAGLPTGEVFSPADLRRVQTRLRRIPSFRAVTVTEAEKTDGQTLDIEIGVTEAPKRRFGFGAEISSLEGLGLSGFWLHRNLAGGAEQLRFDASVSGIGGDSGGEDINLSARFDRPATFNEDTDFFLTAQIERLDEIAFRSRQINVGAGIKRYAREERTYTFGIKLRRSSTEDVFGRRDFTLLSFPTGLVFDYRDNGLNAKEGYYLKADIEPFIGLSGSIGGARSLVDVRAYYTTGPDHQGPLTFALRGQLGALAGPGIDDAPADFLFFSGGGGTVRGQSYQSLGVDVGQDTQAGGRAFLGLSAETRYETTDTLSLVGFVDAGYIGEEAFPDGSSGAWHTGAGLGLRYATGLGPIRLDAAVPISGPGDNDGFQIYIGIGQAF